MTLSTFYSRSPFLAATIAIAIAIATPSDSFAQGKKPPKDPPPTPSLTFSMTTFGALGGDFALATAMSENGHVVGYVEVTPDLEVPFFVDGKSGTMYELTDLLTAADAAAWKFAWNQPAGVNSAGEISMSLQATGSTAYSAVRISLKFDNNGNVVPGQGTVESVSPGGYSATDINDFGDICGSGNGRVFISYADTGFGEIAQTLGGPTAGATNINLLGEVTGSSLNASGDLRAFFYSESSGMVNLGIIESSGPGGDASSGEDINDAGVVVGYASAGKRRGAPVAHAFLHDGETMIDLGTLGGNSSVAYSVNNFNAVVGWSEDKNGGQRYFLYTSELGMIDIEPLITNLPAGAGITVEQINDAGQILGNIYYGVGVSEPFILNPN